METFSALLALCAGNSPVTGEFPHKGQWRGALMFTLICVWINYWAKNREAGNLRRHRAHYGVTVMSPSALNTSVGALYTESRCVFYSWVLRPHNLQKMKFLIVKQLDLPILKITTTILKIAIIYKLSPHLHLLRMIIFWFSILCIKSKCDKMFGLLFKF